MNNPGPFKFTFAGGAFPLNQPGVFAGDWVTGFAGILALSLQAAFVYGSGGSTATLYIQTSLDQGQSEIDIAAIQFGVANGVEVANLSGLTPKTTPFAPTQQALTPGTCVDGVLGDYLRAVLVVAGAGYGSNSSLNVAGVAR